MIFSQPIADVYVPDDAPLRSALDRVTHMGIGAHQDDLEFMAMHGILECFQSTQKWFGGMICTDGGGSVRSGKYANYSDEAMKATRMQEQRAAAMAGQYGVIAQAGHPSINAKDASKRSALKNEIRSFIEACHPEVIYTHNPFDKHATHLGVLAATLEALAELPASQCPQKLIGCEVWRGLDWLPDEFKLVQNLSAHPNLSAALNGVFDSQISGGKRYDLGVMGRRMANATFLDSHSLDEASHVSYAIELTGVMEGRITLDALLEECIGAFRKLLMSQWDQVSLPS